MTRTHAKTAAALGARLIGLLLAAVGLWQLIAAFAASWQSFNPSYLGHYLQTELASPLAAIVVGALTAALGKPLGALLSIGLGEDGE